ncbi:porin family protein [Winogradskyella sp. MIT101101]|uniref:porin family protein n=1 Tax=Winogradskyella sp. MIT101101 TaxID=3098297 RepID=UPI00399A1DE0
MKKITISAIMAFFSVIAINAQDDSNISSTDFQYGLKAGYNSFIERFSLDGDSVSASGSGFYIGFFTDFSISEKFNFQPELLYVLVTHDNVNGDVLVLPLMGKYNIKENFSIQFGPQFDYILEKDTEGIKRLGLGLAIGAGFDISQDLFMDMRYSFGLTDRLDEEYDNLDAKFKINYLQIGLGYRF